MIMELMPWRPFKPLSALQEEMNRLLEEFWGRKRDLARFISPAIDMEETDKDIVVQAEMPGVEPEDIEVSISGNNLVIRGERKQEKEQKKKRYHVMECTYGSFYRSIPLPMEVDTEKVSAEYKKGILRVVLPKSKEVLPKQIKIEVR